MQIQVRPQSLRQRLQLIVGDRSPFNGQRRLTAVENYIEKELATFGFKVESDYFSHRGQSFRNILAGLGPQSGAGLIILGAHFDSVAGSPGADDNASGVAVLLEAARILSQIKLRSQVLFSAFNLEELNMVGSAHLAKQLKAAGTKIRAMISLEMIGYTDHGPGSQRYPLGLKWFYPDRGDFIGVVGNWNSGSLLRGFAGQMRRVKGLKVETLSVPGNGGLIPAVRLSDHAPFWDLGYPALMVTDTSFYRNPHYHRSTDTLETLDIDFMAKVCEGVILGVLGLG